MLNEALTMARSLDAAGFAVAPRHPDVQAPGRKDTLRVCLDGAGGVSSIGLVPPAVISQSWTFANGNHNRFPFVQFSAPIFVAAVSERGWKESRAAERRAILHDAVARQPFGKWVAAWPGDGLRRSLLQRRPKLADGSAAAVLAVVDRALAAFAAPERLFHGLAEALLREVDEGGDDWLNMARRLLVQEGGAVYFDVDDFPKFASDSSHIPAISRALSGQGDVDGVCALTGRSAALLQGNYPKPTLPTLGGVYLFAKNADIPAAGRYGQVGSMSLPVAQSVAEQLGAVLQELTKPEWHGKTWRSVPSERPKESDLLIAFVDPAVPCADLLAGRATDEAEETAEEANLDPRRVYLDGTQRMIETIKGKVDGRASVEVCLLRRVDPGNHKAIYHRRITAGALWAAADRWQAWQDNLPSWVALAVYSKTRNVFEAPPPLLAPLQLPLATRVAYVQGGCRKEEVGGMTAADALALLLDERGAERAARRGLHLVLRRQTALLAGSAHALRRDALGAKLNQALPFDRSAALRGCAVLGLLLAKLDRHKEDYMREAAFKLGQLLAVADLVHVGYCADMRGGQVPPTLIGNSVLNAAQSNPAKALALLGRRWKPYHAWAKRLGAKPKGEEPKSAKDWAVVRAVSGARRMDELSRDLHGSLPDEAPDDMFRAELLLGYLAGLPRRAGEPQDKREEEEG